MKKEDILEIENLSNGNEMYFIRWNLTRLCNYYCDYCIQGNKMKHIQDSTGESEEIRKKICDKLIEFIENKLNPNFKKLRIFLIGGEVTLLNDFISILTKLVNCKFDGRMEFHITTNLSANIDILRKMKEIFINKKNRYLSISTSYYKEFTSEKEFTDKAKFLYKGSSLRYDGKKNILGLIIHRLPGILFSCFGKTKKNHINLFLAIGYPLVFDEDYKSYLKFRRKYKKCSNTVNYIIIRNYKHTISDKLKNKLSKKNGHKIKLTLKNGQVYRYSNTVKMGLSLENKRFIPKGLLCDSGIYNISIGNLGNISRCSSCEKLTTIGNILTDELELLQEKIVCPSMQCNCSYYHIITQSENKK